jgi:ribonuclease D
MKVDYVGPATIQMSTVEASLVVHLCDKNGRPIEDTVPIIQDILANPSVIKAGVGIDQDMLELVRAWKSSDMDICGRFDIGGIGGNNGRTMSLKNLAKGILGVDLFKSKRLAISNWASVPLTDKQIDYAARDAWASAAILQELHRRDPKTYSPQSLLDLVAPDEIGMKEMDVRARARKDAKTQYLDIVGKGDTKVDRKDLSKEQLGEVKRLQGVMKELAPPRYYEFDVEHLGITF